MAESKTQGENKPNRGGWKTCVRGHKYRGPGPCPICWPGRQRPGGKQKSGTTGPQRDR